MDELEGNSGTSKSRKWVETILSFWIDNRNSLGDLIRNGVMVGYNDINSETLSILYNRNISRPTVNSDNELDVFLCEFIEKILLETISIMDSMRESIRTDDSDLLKKSEQERCGTHAVNIVIPEDNNTLSFFLCNEDTINGRLHIWHEKGIMEISDLRMKKSIYVCWGDITIFEEDISEGKWCCIFYVNMISCEVGEF